MKTRVILFAAVLLATTRAAIGCGGSGSDQAASSTGAGGGATSTSSTSGSPMTTSSSSATTSSGATTTSSEATTTSGATSSTSTSSTGAGAGGSMSLSPVLEGYWYWGYSGPSIATTHAKAPAANYIAWFAAIGTGAGDGHITFNGVGMPSASDIAAWKAAGDFITLTVGGSAADVGQPNEIDLNTSAQEANLLADVEAAVSKYGFQGIDIDLENDSGQWNSKQMCQLLSDLKAKLGKSFVIDIDPAPYQLRPGGVYAALYAACGDSIDLVSPQWYSQCNQSDTWFEDSYIGPDLATFTGKIGVPSTKILIGASDNRGDCGAPGGPSTYCNAYKKWTSANPATPLRGIKWFQTASDEASSPPWSFAGTAKSCLGL